MKGKTMKQLSTKSAFRFKKDGKDYIVTLGGLKNDINGNRRYEACIVNLSNLPAGGACASFAYRYTFTGHCLAEVDEAEFALDYHIGASRS